MVEARVRKAAFLREAVRQLKLDGVVVERCRYEELLDRPELEGAHDVLTVRGVRVGRGGGKRLSNGLVRAGGTLLFFGRVGGRGKRWLRCSGRRRRPGERAGAGRSQRTHGGSQGRSVASAGISVAMFHVEHLSAGTLLSTWGSRAISGDGRRRAGILGADPQRRSNGRYRSVRRHAHRGPAGVATGKVRTATAGFAAAVPPDPSRRRGGARDLDRIRRDEEEGGEF